LFLFCDVLLNVVSTSSGSMDSRKAST